MTGLLGTHLPTVTHMSQNDMFATLFPIVLLAITNDYKQASCHLQETGRMNYGTTTQWILESTKTIGHGLNIDMERSQELE